MIRYCHHCGDPLPDDDPRRKYCCAPCRDAARREKRAKTPKSKVCEICGNAYDTHQRANKWCSRRCKKAARRRAKVRCCAFPGCAETIQFERYKVFKFCPRHREIAEKQRDAEYNRRRKAELQIRLLRRLLT